MPLRQAGSRISKQGVKQTRAYCLTFLRETHFPKFVAHKLSEYGDRLYQQCRAGESRRGLWTLFRNAFYLIELISWEALLRPHLCETATGPYGKAEAGP